MFKAVLADSRIWKNVIESISTLVEEGVFIVDPSGVKFRAMDPSRVAMVDMELPKAAFESFECQAETPVGVNLEDMKNIMKRAGVNEKLELEKADDEARLKLRFRGKSSRTFSLPLLDLSKDELSAPKIPFNVTVKTPAGTLLDAIRDAEVVSDFVRVNAEEGVLKVSASGDKGDVEVPITKESGEVLSMEMKEAAHALYSLTYLSKMMVASSMAEMATVMFSTDMPMRLDFNLASGGKIVYYLAPRMEAE